MKHILFLVVFLVSLPVYGQTAQDSFDPHTWEAPYHLPTPTGWNTERFLIPINFAPQISYQGVEDIRFSPGWAKRTSDEYWTYAFLWYLDKLPETNAGIIAGNLKAYYAGLVKSNTDSAKAATTKVIPVTTSFKKSRTEKGDRETYTGTVNMTDYMQRQPITLNCIVHVKSCKGGKSILFYELSPKSFTHPNWINLNQLWLDFTCEKSR